MFRKVECTYRKCIVWWELKQKKVVELQIFELNAC